LNSVVLASRSTLTQSPPEESAGACSAVDGIVTESFFATSSTGLSRIQNTDSWFSTMIDLYALPNDFPGYDLCKAFADPGKRVECLEKELARDVTKQLGDVAVSQRFIPYIQLYEFESLLFSSPAEFLGAFPEENQAIERLLEIRRQCGGPEDIDDGADSAPSKRILQLLPDYVKTVSGILIAKRIGLAAIRRECPHFNRWIARLLEVAASDPS
jgi:hypothetical protein